MNGVFALMVRTLRQDSRNWQSGAIRAGLLLMLLATLILSRLITGLSATGLTFVWWILWCSYVAVSLVCACWFGASITEEREQRALGLLRMTRLNGLGILLGKWCPRLMLVVVLISLQFPLALLGVTLGGVTASQLLAAYVALLAYTFMLSGMGMLASATCHTTERAAGFVAGLWIALSLSPWFGSFCISRLLTRQWVSQALADRVFNLLDVVKDFSLWHRLRSILSTRPDDQLWDFQVWGNLLAGLIAFGAAWIVFEYLTVYRLEIPIKAAPKDRLMNRLFSGKKSKQGGRKTTRFLVGRTWKVALAWREFHFNAGGWWTVIIKSFCYVGIVVLVLVIGHVIGNVSDYRKLMGITLMGVGGFAFIGESLFYSGRVFGTDSFEKTLTSLMLLPISIFNLAWSKVSGFVPALLPAIGCFIAGCVIDWPDARGFLENAMCRQGLLAVTVLVAFIHTAAYFSIHTRGGLLVAFVLFNCSVFFFGLAAQAIRPSRTADDIVLWGIIGVLWLFVGVLQFLIGRSLRHRAAG